MTTPLESGRSVGRGRRHRRASLMAERIAGTID
jgi:hypothetical protein